MWPTAPNLWDPGLSDVTPQVPLHETVSYAATGTSEQKAHIPLGMGTCHECPRTTGRTSENVGGAQQLGSDDTGPSSPRGGGSRQAPTNTRGPTSPRRRVPARQEWPQSRGPTSRKGEEPSKDQTLTRGPQITTGLGVKQAGVTSQERAHRIRKARNPAVGRSSQQATRSTEAIGPRPE